MLRPGDIEYEEAIYCAYDEQSTNYNCVLTFINKTAHHVRLFPASTFAEFMAEYTNLRQIPPQGQTTLKFVMKSTNIISQTQEQIVVFASTMAFGQLFPLASALQLRISLKFTQQFVDDPMIQQIIKEEVESISAQGKNLEKQAKWQQARQRYQQAFQLFRSCIEPVNGMVRCGYQLRDWQTATRDLATAVIIAGDNPQVRLLRSFMLLDCYGSRPDWQEIIAKECHQELVYLRDECYIDLNHDQRVQLKKRIEELEKMPIFSRINVLREELFRKAVQKFNPQDKLGKYYKNASDLQSWLNNLENKQKRHQPTPDEVIDPINYQIMESPHILPSGNSFERKSLQLYFKTNGYKDPISRVDVHPNWVFPNNNLQSYIRNNLHLKQWQQYEYQTIHE